MLFEFKKISSSLNYERANRIGELLSKNKIAYQLKPRVMSVYNIFDSAHLGNMSNQKPKITYSVYDVALFSSCGCMIDTSTA